MTRKSDYIPPGGHFSFRGPFCEFDLLGNAPLDEMFLLFQAVCREALLPLRSRLVLLPGSTRCGRERVAEIFI